MDPPRAKPKLLNKALLSDIASTAAEHHMRRDERANNVAGLYMLDKRFNRKVLYHLDKCDSAEFWGTVVTLDGPNTKSPLQLDSKLFTAVLEHSGLTIPTVKLQCGFDELSNLKLTGVESLKLSCPDLNWEAWPQELGHVVRIIAENGPSLKALLNVPEELFGRLPCGLVLDEFSTRNVEPRDLKIPSLNTKIFKYKIGDDMKIPLAFMRTVNADEIHLQIDRLRAGSPMKPFGEKPANDRTKKLRVAFIDVRMRSLDLGRMFREVAVFFPKLECFELIYKKCFKNDELSNDSHTYEEFTRAVDKIVTGFEKALAEADTAPYSVHPKIHVWYVYANDVLSPPEETHFKCGLLRTDLPPSEEVEPGNEHAYFVKETSANGINLRVDCEIIEGTESVDGSFSDDYTDSEDSVSTAAVVKTPSASDDDFRCCDSDSVISFVHLFMP